MNIQRILSLFLLFLLTPAGHASDIIWGLSAVKQEINQTITSGMSTITATDDATGFGLQADIYYQTKYRFNGTINYVDYTDFTISSASVSADYLVPIDSQKTLFIGATVGGIGQVYASSGLSDSAFSYLHGFRLGGIALLSSNFMLEAGYRLQSTDLKTEFVGGDTSTIDELNELYLSLMVLF